MRGIGTLFMAGCVLATPLGFADARAQAGGEAPELGWSNDLEVNLSVTQGNSNTNTFGVKNTLRRRWREAVFQLKLDAYEFNEADDRYLLADPGQTWLPGETPALTFDTLIEPSVQPDVAKYFVEGKYTRQINEKFFWNAGTSWDRNEDAGILNRYIAFAGVGHSWKDLENFHYSTAYGASYTDREEENPDPLKDERFGGVRLSSNLMKKFGKKKNTTVDADFTINVSLADTSDFSMSMDNGLAVSMTDHLSLRIGLKFLFEKEPALEDVDTIAKVVLHDPDGVPGSGDEYFETVLPGQEQTALDIGEDRVRKKQLDTTFTSGLVITF